MSSTSIGNLVFSGGLSSNGNGGLGTGINVAQIVQESMATQNAELTAMQGQQTQISTEQTALNSLNTDLQALQTATQALTDPVSDLDSMAVQSSQPTVLTATALNGSATAAHSITVTNLATTSSDYTDPVATATTVFGNGTLTIQVGPDPTTAKTITINAANNNDTVNTLAQAINNTPNIGVTASVITDANGARLAIVSNTTGAPGNLTITSTPAAGSTTTPALPGIHTAVAGVNANLTIDGIPIASTSNTVSNAIQGVTLNLLAPSTSPVTLSVGADTTSAATAIGNFFIVPYLDARL